MEEKKVEILTIPPDKVISIEISGYFYQRLNKLMLEYAEIDGTDMFLKAMYIINQGKAKENNYAFNVETLMLLMKGIEEEFQNKGYSKKEEIKVKDIDVNQSDQPEKDNKSED